MMDVQGLYVLELRVMVHYLYILQTIYWGVAVLSLLFMRNYKYLITLGICSSL